MEGKIHTHPQLCMQVIDSSTCMHYLQVIFATVPPPEYWSGGPCFVVSVMYIGGGVVLFVSPVQLFQGSSPLEL